MNLVTIDTSPGNMSMYIAPTNTKYLEMGKNANTINIGPLTQPTTENTHTPNVSTCINGVRIDSNSGNIVVTLASNPYSVNISSSTNFNNTIISNRAFSRNVTTGNSNVAVGHECLSSLTSSNRNIAVGSGAGQSLTTGGYNSLLGGRALASAVTDCSNIAIGYEALGTTISSTESNLAIGHEALYRLNNPAGGGNIAVGYNSLSNLATGSKNIAIGYKADTGATASSDTICIGYQATSNNKSNCIVIGKDAGPNEDNQIILGSASGGQTTWIQGSGGLQVNVGDTVVKKLTATGATSLQNLTAGLTTITGQATVSGNLGIGTTTPDYKLDVQGTGRVTGTTTLAKTTINTITGDRAGQIILNNTIYTNNTTPFNETNGVIDTITSAGDLYNPSGNDSTAKAIMIKGADLDYTSVLENIGTGIWNRTGLGGNVLIRAGGAFSYGNNGTAGQTLKGGHVYIDSGTAACGVIAGTTKSGGNVAATPGNIYLRCGALPNINDYNSDYFSSTYDTKMTVTPTEITTNVPMRISGDLNVTANNTFTTNGPTIFGTNNSRVWPTTIPLNGTGLALGWNMNYGQGDTSFLNYAQNGWGGFRFYTTNNKTNDNYAVKTLAPISCLSLDTSGGAILAAVSGNVGIGVTNPIFKLDVAGTASFAATRIYEETGTTMTSTTGSLVIQHNNPGGQSSIVFPSRNDSTKSDYGYIRYRDDVDNNTGSERSRLEIGCENDHGSGDNINDCVILQPVSGSVGIGVTNPIYKLDVAGDARMSTRIRCNIYDTNDTGAELQIGPSVAGSGKYIRIGENIGAGIIAIGNGVDQNGTISIGTSGVSARTITIGSSAAASNSDINLYGKVTTNNLTVNNGNTFKTNGPTIFGHNGAVGFPTYVPAEGTGVALGWNINIGQGDTSFLNYPQAGWGGFRFYTKSYYTSNNNVGITLAPISCGSLDTSGGAILAAVSGNVGIGVTNPIFKLDVAGTGRFTNTLTGTSATFSGSVGIGTTNPIYAFHIIGGHAGIDGNLHLKVLYSSEGIEIFNTQRWSIGRRTTSNGLFIQPDTGGVNNGLGVSLLATETSWGSASDRRLKKNIVPMESMINKVMQVNPVRYNFIDVPGDRVGFIAQEFMNYFPEFVSECEGTLRITYTEMTSVLTKCIQE